MVMLKINQRKWVSHLIGLWPLALSHTHGVALLCVHLKRVSHLIGFWPLALLHTYGVVLLCVHVKGVSHLIGSWPLTLLQTYGLVLLCVHVNTTTTQNDNKNGTISLLTSLLQSHVL